MKIRFCEARGKIDTKKGIRTSIDLNFVHKSYVENTK